MTAAKTTALRQRMIDDMSARKLGRHRQRGHPSGCKRFALWLGRSPETATADDVKTPLTTRFSSMTCPHLTSARRSSLLRIEEPRRPVAIAARLRKRRGES